MARFARIVVPGIPHHVTQRGNRRQQTFFCDSDFRAYKDFLREWCDRCNVAIWAYCLMTNHTHPITIPEDEEGLCRAIGEAHRRYTRMINERYDWRGHLWQDRFASFPMDVEHLVAAVRYIELNPVRAGIVAHPADYPWSSAVAHLQGRDDSLVQVQPLLDLVGDWATLLSTGMTEKEIDIFRRHESTGRPLGSPAFIKELECMTGRSLIPGKRGPKRYNGDFGDTILN
ncbi:MAG: transposase [Armatimonadota bacterium]